MNLELIAQVPVPHPNADEVLVNVHAYGLWNVPADPFAHAVPNIGQNDGVQSGVVGVVAKMGHKSHRHGFPLPVLKVGDRVYANLLAGWGADCPLPFSSDKRSGHDGSLAEYVVAKDHNVVKLPDYVPFDQAALLVGGGASAYRAIQELKAQPGHYVGIIGGAGAVGHLGIQIAKALGYIVVALDTQTIKTDQSVHGNESDMFNEISDRLAKSAQRLEFCSQMGADLALELHDVTVRANLMEYTKGGCHGIVNFSSDPEAVNVALKCLREHGVLVQAAPTSHSHEEHRRVRIGNHHHNKSSATPSRARSFSTAANTATAQGNKDSEEYLVSYGNLYGDSYGLMYGYDYMAPYYTDDYLVIDYHLLEGKPVPSFPRAAALGMDGVHFEGIHEKELSRIVSSSPVRVMKRSLHSAAAAGQGLPIDEMVKNNITIRGCSLMGSRQDVESVLHLHNSNLVHAEGNVLKVHHTHCNLEHDAIKKNDRSLTSAIHSAQDEAHVGGTVIEMAGATTHQHDIVTGKDEEAEMHLVHQSLHPLTHNVYAASSFSLRAAGIRARSTGESGAASGASGSAGSIGSSGSSSSSSSSGSRSPNKIGAESTAKPTTLLVEDKEEQVLVQIPQAISSHVTTELDVSEVMELGHSFKRKNNISCYSESDELEHTLINMGVASRVE